MLICKTVAYYANIIIPNKQTTWYALPSKGHIFHYVFVFRYLSSFFEHIIMTKNWKIVQICVVQLSQNSRLLFFFTLQDPGSFLQPLMLVKLGYFLMNVLLFWFKLFLCYVISYVTLLAYHIVCQKDLQCQFSTLGIKTRTPQLWLAILG